MYKLFPIPPDKFIYEEKQVAIAYTTHIKCDRKPFKYLYLKGDDKEHLESYLINFKNNKDQYTNLGIHIKVELF